MTEDPLCQLCRASVGTLAHRRQCVATRAARGCTPLPAHLREAYDDLTSAQQRLLLDRGLLASVDLSQHPPSDQDSFGWTLEPEAGLLLHDWTVYLDGSFRDGPTEDMGRTGWGFIARDPEGRVKAAAFGVPPPWIRSIHGAEMWALFAALRCALPGIRLRSDRKAVVDTFHAGRRRATAASDEHARLWSMIFEACDEEAMPEVVWMPAHTSAADVGRTKLSNGAFLSTLDRAANDAADTLAKRGAETHRIPREVRKRVKQRELLAIWATRSLAVATYAANHTPDPSGKGLLRDSAGLPRAARHRLRNNGFATGTHAAASEVKAAPCPGGEGHEGGVIESPRADVPSDTVEVSSSEDEVLVLSKMGPMPTAGARELARAARAKADAGRRTMQVTDAASRRSRPARSVPLCPSQAEIVRTFTATANAARIQPAHVGTPGREAEGSEQLLDTLPLRRQRLAGGEQRPVKARAGSAATQARDTANAIASLLG